MPNGYNSPPIEIRFWSKVNKTETCWLWTASLNKFGYGAFGIGTRASAAKSSAWALAHRWAYEATYGPIPSDRYVLHRCHIRACVRPDHLYLGTQADNMRDMVEAGHNHRMAGEDHPRAKLTAASVRLIRMAYQDQARQIDLARRFGVSPEAIANIVHGRRWIEGETP